MVVSVTKKTWWDEGFRKLCCYSRYRNLWNTVTQLWSSPPRQSRILLCIVAEYVMLCQRGTNSFLNVQVCLIVWIHSLYNLTCIIGFIWLQVINVKCKTLRCRAESQNTPLISECIHGYCRWHYLRCPLDGVNDHMTVSNVSCQN